MEDVWIISFRTIVMYFLILLVFRIMGKREVAELGVQDLVVFLILAEIVAVAIVDPEIKIWEVIIPMVLLLIIQLLLSYISLKNQRLREILDGKPTLLISYGKIDEQAMKKERYNFDDLIQRLREKDIFDLAEVAFAILEPSGQLTVLKKETEKNAMGLPLPLILDGIIQTEHLRKLKYESAWLVKELQQRGYEDVQAISYCSYNNGKFYVDLKD